MERAKLNGTAREFVTAGRAVFTLVSIRTGTRYTYRVSQIRDRHTDEPEPGRWFVGVLSGPDNGEDYTFLGLWCEDGGRLSYRHGRKSRAGEDAGSVVAFRWFTERLNSGQLPDTLEVWHEGRCGRCGRRLTVPESVARGIGPECASKV